MRPDFLLKECIFGNIYHLKRGDSWKIYPKLGNKAKIASRTSFNISVGKGHPRIIYAFHCLLLIKS